MDPKPSSERSQDIIQEVKPVFIHEGYLSSSPIPLDSPNVKSPDITVIEAKNRTKEEGDNGYDQCSAAQKMMKGEGNGGVFTEISLPFSTSTPIKGAYICIGGESSISPPPSHLIFSLTSSKGEKMFKKYEFPELENDSWFFLPIDLPDVVLCEISGKGRKKESFRIYSLVFISREEIPEEIKACEAREKLWSEAPVVKPKFVKEGWKDSIPIPHDDPKLVDPSFSMVKCKNDSYRKESEEYDQSEKAQKMLKGESRVKLSHLSIPFPSPSPMKGAYICVNKYDSSPSFLFTFTDCDGKKTCKKYEFTRPKHWYEWHFLPIDLDNVVLCEIEGKGTWYEKNSRCFDIRSLVFFREETPEERCIREDKPKFIHEGNHFCLPIPRDSPNVKSPDITVIEAKNRTKEEGDEEYDQSFNAQKMMKGEEFHRLGHCAEFTDISLPFSTSTPIKGAYICIGGRDTGESPPSHLIFSLTSSKGEKTIKKYEFPEFRSYHWSWFFLPIDLPDVILCEITGKGRKKEYFRIDSLVFISREETPEEIKSREPERNSGDRKSQGRESIPIPRDDSKPVDSPFSMVKCKNDAFCKESEYYDQSSGAQKMLKGEDRVSLSHLSIPFPSPSPMKGAYICVDNDSSSPSLLFTFTDCDGKKTFKKYEFTRPEHQFEWHFLPIDLDNVVLCEIEGKGRWNKKNSRHFDIPSLVFFREETPEERCIREQWSKAPTIKSEFVNSGDASAIPIPRDNAAVNNPSFEMVKGKNYSKSKESEKYDQSEEAQEMLKGEGSVELSHLSIPFPSPSPMKGAYICVDVVDSSPSLLFTFTDCDGKKTFKKYEFTELKHYHEWHFLPIDLANVVLCEIEGKGSWWWKNSRYFVILSLVFFREETPEERCIRESIEEQWSKAPTIESEFVNSGDPSAIPIPRDNAAVNNPSFEMVKGKNYSVSKESEEYDQSEKAQKMLKGESRVKLSHLSIPFPSPSPMKGAYICVNKNTSSPSLLFTFTDCDGKKTFKKYEFIEPENDYEWHFLPIDLYNVVLCEIEGKGRWKKKNSRCFAITSLVFLKQRILLRKAEYIYNEDPSCIPIPRDDPTFIIPEFFAIKARINGRMEIEYESLYYQSDCAQAMMMIKGEGGGYKFYFISIPFKSSTSIKCAYICLCLSSRKSPSLTFTFTSSNGNEISYLYKFDEFSDFSDRWFRLSIDLSDVVSCDIKRYEEEREHFDISSLAFYREETPDEYIARKKQKIDLEELWLKSSPVIPISVTKEIVDSLDDTSIIKPSFSDVTCKNNVCCKESEKYDQSLDAQKMLKGEGDIVFSHISIPFQSLNSIKGAYITLFDDCSALLFTFTLSNGKKISKRYEFTEDLQKPKYYFFLPIDLPNVVLCEIQGKWTGKYEKGRRSFKMKSLIFIKGEDIPPLPSDSTKLIKHDSFTLTSSATMTPQCIIGYGGFGEVLLVKVEGIPIPCVLKKMLREADESVVKECRKEFKMQLKLFTNGKCFIRIPRPLYILDLLDADMKGEYGFIMEYCAGGSVSAFARSWCDDGKYVSDIGDADDSEDSDSSCISDSDSKYNIGTTHFDPMTLNPVKVCSLCVGMIECLDDVFRAKKDLVHRDVKPDNFLVRVDPKDGECTVVLSDLGMVQVLDSITSSVTSKSYIPSSSSTKQEKRLSQPKPSA
ncbi:hypothetical protein ADUPG1_010144, partial [Aduncisulcus paluster]